MIEISYKLTDPRGMHARPAGQLVKVLSGFKSNVQIGTEDKLVDGKRLLAVMKLAMQQGDTLILKFDGEDEKEASEKSKEFLEANL